MVLRDSSSSHFEQNCSDGDFPKGKVFIVGAGIGGVEYLTVKAHQILLRAEVILYDALADQTLLQIAPSNCLFLPVGKRGGKDSILQSEINQLLIEKCQQGKCVVRLKSGDPWIFGRSISEIQALQQAKCEFEVIPGISSAIAAPIFAGIPLTDTESSSCFTVLTGHDLEILPWQALNQMPTLVILMGTRNLAQILDKILLGKAPETAIAIVQWCGRSQQQIWTGILANILTQLPSQSLSPAVIIVGDVVKYHHRIYNEHQFGQNSFSETQLGQLVMQENEELKQELKIEQIPMETPNPQVLPLRGQRILVTRAAGQSSQFREMLIAKGAEVIEMPTLAILPPTSWEPLDQAIANLALYDWLILTSSNAVDSFFARLHQAKKDGRALHKLKIAVVGKKTADVLGKYGLIPDLIPPNFIADALIETLLVEFPAIAGMRILFPRVESGGREVLIEQFQHHGAMIAAIPAYESGCPTEIDAIALESIQTQQIDVITFASSKTVKHFCQLLSSVAAPEVWRSWLLPVKIASIGPQTTIACRELIGRIDCEAVEYTLEGLTTAIGSSD
jgi:uroporphyrinogen III methyltransferase / synthase